MPSTRLHPAAGRSLLAGATRHQPDHGRHRAGRRRIAGHVRPASFPELLPALGRGASLHAAAPTRRRSRQLLVASGAVAGVAMAGFLASGASATPANATSAGAAAVQSGAAGDVGSVAGSNRRVELTLAARQHTTASAASRGTARAALHRTVVAAPHAMRAKATVAPATPDGSTFHGLASWYGPGFNGQRTASGAIYDENGLSAASRTLPLGSHLKVCYDGACVVVVINDRGPAPLSRVLDLSEGAAKAIGMMSSGVGEVSATPVTA